MTVSPETRPDIPSRWENFTTGTAIGERLLGRPPVTCTFDPNPPVYNFTLA